MTIKEKEYLRKQFSEKFLQFSRNLRWGTCGGCPRDADGHAYPEFCEYTKRYDHNLTLTELRDVFYVQKKCLEELKERIETL
jgi:hypothetical protein